MIQKPKVEVEFVFLLLLRLSIASITGLLCTTEKTVNACKKRTFVSLYARPKSKGINVQTL